MTIKQQKALSELPKCNYNMAESMRRAGYSKATAYAGKSYEALRRAGSKLDFFNPERIKHDIDTVYNKAIKKDDIDNLCRINEHRSKIAGMIKERHEVNNLNPERITIVEIRKENALPLKTESLQLESTLQPSKTAGKEGKP